ncbi:alpha/beta fold hydrolase [Pseudopelagicola sp. nBUS_19]|uniref:alpha/beta fold hydrolase n=1 Tax=unclassified Pseudopelagicola TaxID=2649563 RepID=UPI003EC04BCF
MSDILLVHGSCHGAWCWCQLTPELDALGHTPRSIDMPSHGADLTPITEVTLDSCAQSVVDALGSDTVVVAHSWAGFPVTQAADMAPKQIARVIYLCAYFPWNGYSLADMRRKAPRQPLAPAIVHSLDGYSFGIDPAMINEVFYHDCPPEAVELARARLGQQAISPQETPIQLGDTFKKVAKSYIRCTDDRTIPPEFQVTMTDGWPAENLHEMPTGHSPFFADPKGLAALIDKIIRVCR